MDKGYVVFNIRYCKKTEDRSKRYCTSNIDKFHDMIQLLIMDDNEVTCWVEIKLDRDD